MKAFFRSFFASLLALIVVLFLVMGGFGWKAAKKPKVKDRSYLVIDIYGEIMPYDPPDGVIAEVLGGKAETIHRILDNLDKARADKRIKGLVLKVSSSSSVGLAAIEEIRGAITRFRESGRVAYAFSDHLDRNTLFLASACDSIYMPPTAELFFVGFGGAVPYIKGTLEKLGVKPHVHKIKDYKSAAELVTRADMSPEARRMQEWILDDIWKVQMKTLSEERGVPDEKLVQLMEHALFTAGEAKNAGLIDEVIYWDQLEARLKEKDDEELRTATQEAYGNVERRDVGLKGKKKIAVVHAFGLIGGRKSRIDPMLGVMMGHETVGSELRRARRDKDVAAVVFRVDSRGGEALTSDLISREVDVLAGAKPVVVSMLNVAASGGYDISYRASKIMADPMTITGSIGSISAKFNTTGFYNKLGVTFDFLSKGPNGLIFSEHTDFSEAQRKRFEQNHWDAFNLWFEDVAKRRGLSVEELDRLAQGRIWTGRQAVENGLIDEVGGLDRAIDVAKELAGIPLDEKVTIVHYPKRKGLLATLAGGECIQAAAKWTIYRLVRQDLTETLKQLAGEQHLLWYGR